MEKLSKGQRVAIYCRLSDEDRDKQDKSQDSRSIQTQKNMLMHHALEQGWDIYKIYSDDDFSGADADRIEYQQLLADAAERKFDIVLCKHQSRFTRDMEHVERYIHDKFQEWGIRFVSLLDGADTDIRGNKKSRQINGLVNEWYLEDLSENVRAAQKVRKADGKYVGSSFPYGYLKDPENVNRLIIDPAASNVVRRIFCLYEDGMGAEQIAKILNSEGIPNPSRYKSEVLNVKFNNSLACRYKDRKDGKQSMWSSSSILMILKNETYIGSLVQNRSNSISYKNHKRIKNKKEDWIVCEDIHEPIITREQFEKVQAIRKKRTRPARGGKRHLLSGVLRCGQCGSNLIINSTPADGRKYYSCQYHRIAPAECTGITASEKVIANAVLSQLKTYLAVLDAEKITAHIQVKMKQSDQKGSLQSQLDTKAKESEKIDLVVRQLYMDKVTGLISAEQFVSFNKSYAEDQIRLKREIEALKKKLDELGERQRKIEEVISNKMVIVNAAKKYIDAAALTKDMVEELIDYINVFDAPGHGAKKIEIHWKF